MTNKKTHSKINKIGSVWGFIQLLIITFLIRWVPAMEDGLWT